MKWSELIKARWILWVWKHTPNCADMSRLASLGLDRPLPWGTRLRMRLHYSICVWCRRYGKQIRFLRDWAHRHPESLAEAVPHTLSEEARERIKRKLRQGDEG